MSPDRAMRSSGRGGSVSFTLLNSLKRFGGELKSSSSGMDDICK